ncbi:MAG TPA: mechanosensitive ion channel family protein [Gemmatimonadaceae bacterium]|nr:mechanosensitive ion channel family protein [Gemmatimonadaceae bacterium]
MRLIDDWLHYSWRGATVTQWLAAAAVFGATYVLLAVVRRVLVRRLGALAARTSTQLDDVAVAIVARTRWFFLLLIAAHAAARVVNATGGFAVAFRAVSVVLVLMQAGVWGNGLIAFATEHYVRQRATEDVGMRTTITALGYALRFTLWALLVVTALQNFGINVTALVTGLGIGGIAIALAVQNILGDLFAALAIVLDKPFVVGDAITVDSISGTVEHVGLKTTRIRSVSGEQVIVANSDLLKSKIRNYKRMEHRRVVFTLDVDYATPPDALGGIPAMVRRIIEARPKARFDRCHLLTLAESALRFEVVYFLLDADYTFYADTQHAVNLAVMRAFAAAGIEFAFPSRTVFLRSPATGAAVAQTSPTPSAT